jgi:Ca2+-binding EF-hand superfamily protein
MVVVGAVLCSVISGRKTVFRIQKITLSMITIAALFAVGSLVENVIAQEKQNVPKVQDKVALSAEEVKGLVLMMDVDKSGKISKKEFMDFMAAEFDRLDKDKSGELDVKELAQSQFRPSARPAFGK